MSAVGDHRSSADPRESLSYTRTSSLVHISPFVLLNEISTAWHWRLVKTFCVFLAEVFDSINICFIYSRTQRSESVLLRPEFLNFLTPVSQKFCRRAGCQYFSVWYILIVVTVFSSMNSSTHSFLIHWRSRIEMTSFKDTLWYFAFYFLFLQTLRL